MEMIQILRLLMLLAVFQASSSNNGDVYIVSMNGEPVVTYHGGVEGFAPTAIDAGEKIDVTSESVSLYSMYLEREHDALLEAMFTDRTYKKLYSYSHLFNGFALHTTPEQAEALSKVAKVKHVEKDMKVKKLTVHTPKFLGLSTEVWPTGGGSYKAGEDVIIGLVDSGIFPGHPSFSVNKSEPYEHLPRYKGKCEVHLNYRNFCNGKIIGAQHFAAAAIASGQFNPSADFASPFDGDGHGSHIAAIAAGRNGVPVRMYGHEFGKASGMAPRARIAIYKAIYRNFGGFVADVLAAIEQAVKDGVDILNLSLGLNSPSSSTSTTFLNAFDIALLSAVKAGVFVAQAVGNTGPYEKSLVSYSPWVTTVAAAVDDRRYKNFLHLRNGMALQGIGLSPSTHGNQTYRLVAASDIMLDSSVAKYSPSDCQRPEFLDKKRVEGNILVCGYSFNFVMGNACIKKVSETARMLGAAGFVLIVENASPDTRFDPVAISTPGILISDEKSSEEFIRYYDSLTKRDYVRRAMLFGAEASIGDGLKPILYKSAPQVALFSSRGPDVKDVKLQEVDVLKPDILAPGSLIWAAWSLNGTDEANYLGEGFALLSGSSMAAPHIAGIAALIKQKHPEWTPAAIKSALMTTASISDRAGRPILAQKYSDAKFTTLTAGNPFDYGAGAVNPKAAVDPGLVFDAGYSDYISFICSVPDIDFAEISRVMNTHCNSTGGDPANLNLPSIAVSRLRGTRVLKRTVTNVAETETYIITSRMQPDIALEVTPSAMTVRSGASHQLTVTLTPRYKTGTYSFGEILFKGSRGHKVRIPVAAVAYND